MLSEVINNLTFISSCVSCGVGIMLMDSLIYCLSGEYFFGLDQKSVLPGYPKLIKDVWGISGPIDAAFTRFNCQGKTYIFKVENELNRLEVYRYISGIL